MADSFDSVKDFSLQARALHALAKVCWGDFVLILTFDDDDRDNFDFISDETKNILTHRKTVVKRISETFSSDLPKILKDQLVDAVVRLQRGYCEALVWTEMHSEDGYEEDRLVIPHPLTTGPYSAKNFIDLTGHFDELAWAKRFVGDENLSALYRFELACNYCFEETIQDLWCSTINKGRNPYVDSFGNIIWGKGKSLVWVWVCRLENKLDQLVKKESTFSEGFYVGGFRKAMKLTNEYATRFFWAGCSYTEKADLIGELNENNSFKDLSEAAFLGYAGYVNFIYSLLSLEQKRNLISNDIEEDDHETWSCLLTSAFYEPVLNDIQTIPFPTSNSVYASILRVLISKMIELPISEYKKIFEALWEPLSQEQRKEMLEMDNYLIRELTKLKDMDLLEMVIRPFPPDVKERMLLYDWQYTGVSVLGQFSKEGDYDALLRYLLLILVDRDPKTQILSVRRDASSLLDRFVSGDIFILFTTNGRIRESERREIVKVIQDLQCSMLVVHTLLNRVEDEEEKLKISLEIERNLRGFRSPKRKRKIVG